MHLAGHGHYEPPTTPGGKARSGMVLDNGVFLTAVEVGQMQQVPELVFLNCCHIGQTGPEAAVPRTPTVEFNRLAASVSRELIEMGVRAVVAAGWAVRTTPQSYSQRCSTQHAGGDTFGRALKKARDDTYDKFPDSNTWGAYQAYGDPDYRLDPDRHRRYVSRTGKCGRCRVHRGGARHRRGTAENDGSVLDGSSGPALRNLKALVADCPTDWLAQTDVLMEIGYAYGRLGEFESASQYLATALAGDGDDSTTTLRAVAELANYEAHLADELHRSSSRTHPRVARARHFTPREANRRCGDG